MKKIYFAGPLFNDAEREWNMVMFTKLSKEFEVFLPQLHVQADPTPEMLVKAGHSIVSTFIYEQDKKGIDSCDILLLVMDGRTIDEGACWEHGYAYAKGKTCWGLKTDSRRVDNEGPTLMVDESLEKVFRSVEEILEYAKESDE